MNRRMRLRRLRYIQRCYALGGTAGRPSQNRIGAPLLMARILNAADERRAVLRRMRRHAPREGHETTTTGMSHGGQWGYRAHCSCGWTGWHFLTESVAEAQGRRHRQ